MTCSKALPSTSLAILSIMPHHLPCFEAKNEARVSDLAFLEETSADSGLIAADRLSNLLHITRAELAIAMGLSRDAVLKSADSDDRGHQFQSDRGHHSDLMAAT